MNMNPSLAGLRREVGGFEAHLSLKAANRESNVQLSLRHELRESRARLCRGSRPRGPSLKTWGTRQTGAQTEAHSLCQGGKTLSKQANEDILHSTCTRWSLTVDVPAGVGEGSEAPPLGENLSPELNFLQV